jgi:hypothetical protein
MLLVQSALASKKERSMAYQQTQPNHLKTIAALGRLSASCPTLVVTPLRDSSINRRDAEDHRMFLRRFMPKASFEVIFDVPDSLQGKATD